MMNKTTQSKINYHSVFINSMQFGMARKDSNKFLCTQFNQIQPAIDKAIEFLNHYDYGDYSEDIYIHSISCLPFMIFDGVLENPLKETQASYEQSVQFLQYMKYNKGMAQHYLNEVINDFKGINEEKLDKALDINNQLQYKKVLRNSKTWWGKAQSATHLAHFLHLAWSDKQKDIVDFLCEYFELFNTDVDSESIKTNLYLPSKSEDFVRLNPNFLKDHIL